MAFSFGMLILGTQLPLLWGSTCHVERPLVLWPGWGPSWQLVGQMNATLETDPPALSPTLHAWLVLHGAQIGSLAMICDTATDNWNSPLVSQAAIMTVVTTDTWIPKLAECRLTEDSRVACFKERLYHQHVLWYTGQYCKENMERWFRRIRLWIRRNLRHTIPNLFYICFPF